MNDPKGDSGSDVDIKWARVNHDNKTITFTVRDYNKTPKNVKPCIQTKVGHDEYWIGCFGNKMVHLDTPEETRISAERGGRRVEFTIKRKQIGNPDQFRWRAAFLEEDEPADAAPNKGYAKHSL